MQTLYHSRMSSPAGQLWIAVSDAGLVRIEFGEPDLSRLARRFHCIPSEDKTLECRTQLQEYFAGRRTNFTLPLDLQDGTPFQRQCWNALLEIPYGQTRTYQQIAEIVRRPQAFRAVGQANHHNPIAIVIPCHRVINTDGRLAGYGGGLHVKELLLNLEGAYKPDMQGDDAQHLLFQQR